MIILDKKEKIYLLNDTTFEFPTLDMMNGDLVAIGGDFNPNRLVLAYKHGLFPWFIENKYIYWFCPNKRMVLYPNNFKVSKNFSKIIKNKKFTVEINKNFSKVINRCASINRKNGDNTWIDDNFIQGYENLFNLKIAISIESYLDDKLVGGLYGLKLGNIFFGESMFSEVSNASKVALYHLCDIAKKHKIALIDCQVHNDHLERLGAYEINRKFYFKLLEKYLE